MIKILSTADEISPAIRKLFPPILETAGVPSQFVEFKEESSLAKVAPGDVVLALGKSFVDMFQPELGYKKRSGMDSVRLKPWPHPAGYTVLFSYDPAITMFMLGFDNKIRSDIQFAIRYARTGKTQPELGTYEWVTDFSAVIAEIEAKYAEAEQRVPVSLDLETMGLDPHDPGKEIVSVSLTIKAGESKLYYCLGAPADELAKVVEQLKWICTTPKVKMIGANLKYDSLWIVHKWGFWITNQTFDTYLVGTLLNENEGNSLKDHAWSHTPMGGYEDELYAKYDIGHMEEVPKEDLITYAGGDTDACYRTAQVMAGQLKSDARLTNFYVNLLQPSAKVFAKLENRGVLVDMNRYHELKAECETELARLHKEAIDLLPQRIKLKYSDNLALTRDVIIREYLFTERGLNLEPQMMTETGKLPSCAAEHLKMFLSNEDAKPFISTLLDYNKAEKTLSTYIIGFMKHIRSDGRFHPAYRLGKGGSADFGESGGTDTGRTSTTAPAYQTIPKRGKWAKLLRTVYVPPPGYCILKADFSQGELRIIADVAPENTMLAAYNEGRDLHAMTAAQVNGYTMEEFYALGDEQIELLRYGAKAINFGFVYGLQAEGFVDYAWKGYGVAIDLATSTKWRNGFFALYTGLEDWHENRKKLAAQQGFIRNPLGRVRHLPLIKSKDWSVKSRQERQGINAEIQSCLSDMMQLGMVELDRRYPDLWMFGMTHDSLEMYVPIGEHELWAKRVKEVLENLPVQKFGYTPRVKFAVDFEFSETNLGAAKKLKIAT